jgi:molybdopterin-containing oxidoreductase family membrane subunit
VLILIIPLRRLLRLERYVTGLHLDVMCRIMLTSSLFLAYAYLMDAFQVFYGADPAEHTEFVEKVWGYYAGIYWATIVFNIALPQLLWFAAIRMNQAIVLLISFGIIIGMWCERYTIVVVSLHRSHLPSSWGVFHGTVWDWLTMAGTVGLFFFGILLIVRLLPVISMFELRELVAEKRP